MAFTTSYGTVSDTRIKFNPVFEFVTLTFIVESIVHPEAFLDDLIQRVQPYRTQYSKIGCAISQVGSFAEPFYIEFRTSVSGEFILHRLSLRLQSQKKYLDTRLYVVFTANKAKDPVST
jgi:hypothetical protein